MSLLRLGPLGRYSDSVTWLVPVRIDASFPRCSAGANPGKAHRITTGPATRPAIRDLRRKQTRTEENVQPSRKLVQGRQAWRGVSCSPLLSRGRFGNGVKRPCSARTGEREISRTARGNGDGDGDGDVSIVRLHRSSFNGITLSATKGHTLFLNAPWTEHDCRAMCFRCNSPLTKRLPYEGRQSKGSISKNEARRRTATCNPCLPNRKKV